MKFNKTNKKAKLIETNSKGKLVCKEKAVYEDEAGIEYLRTEGEYYMIDLLKHCCSVEIIAEG